MRKLCCRSLLLAMLWLPVAQTGWGAPPATRLVTDFAGRQVKVPARVNRIYCAVMACALLVYSLAPEKLVAWPGQPGQLSGKAMDFLDPRLQKLPRVSLGFDGGGAGNVEGIMALHPDLVFYMGGQIDPAMHHRMEVFEKQSGMPTYYINMTLEQTPEIYERLGALLGVEARARDLASYSRQTLHEVVDKVRAIPRAKRPRVYYAAGLNGLQTIRAGDDHISAIETAGGINVAEVQASETSLTISIEQLLLWKPDIVLANVNNGLNAQFYSQTIWHDVLWQSLPALKNHAVFQIPSYPFGWASPPASINRLLGIKWLAKLFYPSLFSYDMRQETRAFYAKFYYRQLTDAQLDDLLAHALR